MNRSLSDDDIPLSIFLILSRNQCRFECTQPFRLARQHGIKTSIISCATAYENYILQIVDSVAAVQCRAFSLHHSEIRYISFASSNARFEILARILSSDTLTRLERHEVKISRREHKRRAKLYIYRSWLHCTRACVARFPSVRAREKPLSGQRRANGGNRSISDRRSREKSSRSNLLHVRHAREITCFSLSFSR